MDRDPTGAVSHEIAEQALAPAAGQPMNRFRASS
jgi:hypothetical protein